MTSATHQIPWLPLAKAAERIASSTGKPHSGSDVIAAALKGYITLSKLINSPTPARAGQFQERYRDSPFRVSTKKLLYAGVGFWGSEGDVFAYASKSVEHVHGVFDLLLIGNGRGKIENIMHGITDDDDDEPFGGIYLQGPTGTIWEIQEEVTAGACQDHGHECEYVPAERFPADWRIVVRTSELNRFIEEITGSNDSQTLAISTDGKVAKHQQYAPNKPATAQEGLVAGGDVDHKSLLGAMDKVPGHAKLCRAFGYGEKSFTAVSKKVKEYNRRFPENTIHFKHIEGKTPFLYSYEIQKIREKIGECKRNRPRKKTSEKT